MPRESVSELKARIERLEAENAALQTEAELLERSVAAQEARAENAEALAAAVAPATRRGGAYIGRSILAAIMVVLGIILTPVALLAQFAIVQLTDTDVFVATYAPLASSPEVQAAVTDAVVDAVKTNIDIDGITSGLIDGLTQLDLPPIVERTLPLLKGPIVQGVDSLVRWGVSSVVASDWFPVVWEQCLRLTHSQMNAVLRGDTNAVATIDGDDIALQLGPVVALLKQQLLDNGVQFASLIPDNVDISIPLATVEGIGQVKTAYALGVAAAAWLPIVAAALIVGGIAVAPRRRGWVLGASISVGLIGAILAVVLSVGRTFVVATGFLNADAIGVIFDGATSALSGTVAAMIAIGVVGVVAAWLSGPWRPAVASRRGIGYYPGVARRRMHLTNPVSAFLTRYPGLVRWIVALAVVATIVFWRPLSVGVVIVASLLGAVVLLAVEALRSPSPGEIAPVVVSVPVVEVEPAVDAEPAVAAEPVDVAEPVVPAEPVLDLEPVDAAAEPVEPADSGALEGVEVDAEPAEAEAAAAEAEAAATEVDDSAEASRDA